MFLFDTFHDTIRRAVDSFVIYCVMYALLSVFSAMMVGCFAGVMDVFCCVEVACTMCAIRSLSHLA